MVTEHIKEYLPEESQDASVSILMRQRNNDVTLHELLIKTHEDAVVSKIYMEGFYKQYENGLSLESILGQIAEEYISSRTDKLNGIGDWFYDYEKVKDRLVLKVVNKEKNASLLKTLPHKDLVNTDLTVIYMVLLEIKEQSSVSINVENDYLKFWGIESNDLYQVALENTERFCPAQIGHIEDVVSELLEGKKKDRKELSDYVIEPYNQYVLSNEQRLHGAAVMLYPDVLHRLAQNAGGNLFVLPSGTNEILLIKDDGKLTAAELQAVVIDTNLKVVEPEEFLSDEVYYYDREEQSLSMATDREQTKELLEWLVSQCGSQEMENEWEPEV